MSVTPNAGCVDVVIVGAGISGLGAAYRIIERNPQLTYTILERRARIGGTWDLFRYPGVRSDSSIFTLSFPYEPWTREEGIADGAHIREYLTDMAHKYGIDRHIEFNSYVHAADWDSSTDTWTVTFEQNGVHKHYRSRFVFFGSGYYNYDEGYTPDFGGIEKFGGAVVHPQHWPEDLDYTGKKIVVIGSGATAVTLIPSLTDRAEKVTMLQRSPTYLISASKYSTFAAVVRKALPPKTSHALARFPRSACRAEQRAATLGASGVPGQGARTGHQYADVADHRGGTARSSGRHPGRPEHRPRGGRGLRGRGGAGHARPAPGDPAISNVSHPALPRVHN